MKSIDNIDKNPQFNWIKAYIIDVLPFMSLGIYVLAFLYNNAFYSVFNINIVSYISWSELLLSIIEPLFYFSFTGSVIAFCIYFSFLQFSTTVEIETIENNTHSCFLIQRIKETIKKHKFIAIFFSVFNELFFIRERSNKSYSYIFDLMSDLMFLTTISTISRYILTKINNANDYTLSQATLGLIIPMLIVYLLLFFGFFLTSFHVNIFGNFIKYINSLKPGRKAIFFIFYYIYAINTFQYCGKNNGLYYKEHRIPFEICLVDGSVFSDSLYIYIGQTNSNIFLRKSQSDDNIILCNEAVVYTKINSKERYRAIKDPMSYFGFGE